MPDIVLSTLNARAIHASLGLRYLLANLGPLRSRAALLERTIDDRPVDVVEEILALRPRLVGLGVYIWNVGPTLEVVRLLRQLAPQVVVVLGGPEVSHEVDDQPITALAHHVVTGEGDLAFRELCDRVLAGRPAARLIHGGEPDVANLTLPYDELSDDDLRWRSIYVEASRGCPYRCSFCLSALARGVRAFPEEALQGALARLLARGATNLRFVDRTFNLHPDAAVRLLRFLRQRRSEELFLHFEMVPDRFPEELQAEVAGFPEGALQFEVGIQTWDPEVSRRIARPLRADKVEANLRWLREHTGVHLHTDLIVGLPGEDMASFGRGFSRLTALRPHEIQVGVLKRLRGAPVNACTEEHGMLYSHEPPYEVVQTDALSFQDLQELKRFARIWDLFANKGAFPTALPLLLESAGSPFEAVRAFTAFVHAQVGPLVGLSLLRQAELLLDWLLERVGPRARDAVLADYTDGGRRRASHRLLGTPSARSESRRASRNHRQRRHQR